MTDKSTPTQINNTDKYTPSFLFYSGTFQNNKHRFKKYVFAPYCNHKLESK